MIPPLIASRSRRGKVLYGPFPVPRKPLPVMVSHSVLPEEIKLGRSSFFTLPIVVPVTGDTLRVTGKKGFGDTAQRSATGDTAQRRGSGDTTKGTGGVG